ncbi:MAG: hypothetical protein IKT68_07665 [Clostridia bacterium]|nr:hypothetical protein [Clostridia bacterium]
MKKIVLFLLAITLCLTFCSCGGSSTPVEEFQPTLTILEIEDMVEREVEYELSHKINSFKYNTSTTKITYCDINETSKHKFTVTGQLTVKDKYGDEYVKKFDAVAQYNPDTLTADTISCEVHDS